VTETTPLASKAVVSLTAAVVEVAMVSARTSAVLMPAVWVTSLLVVRTPVTLTGTVVVTGVDTC